ncbi:MAG TPA: hydroxymethylbilane synthase, partial [Candidatus Dormibacteraeota bacterium]|nr:hydroxymethylbilane synthase [Candidatus Dormibacteraeota bacterium]
MRAPAHGAATHPIVSRRSALARAQTTEACSRLAAQWPAHHFPMVPVDSRGDEARELPAAAMTGTGWFTAALEAAVLQGRGEAAVHSAKDLPTEMPPGLTVAGYLPRADPR